MRRFGRSFLTSCVYLYMTVTSGWGLNSFGRSNTNRYLSLGRGPRFRHALDLGSLVSRCQCSSGGKGWCQPSGVEASMAFMGTMGFSTVQTMRTHYVSPIRLHEGSRLLESSSLMNPCSGCLYRIRDQAASSSIRVQDKLTLVTVPKVKSCND